MSKNCHYRAAAALFTLLKGQVLKILSGNQILTSVKGHCSSATNNKKKTGNNLNLDVVNIIADSIKIW